MTNTFMHPDRFLALSAQQSSANTVPAESPASAEPLSPGAEAARKECINEQLIGLCAIPAKTKASVQGIGLYTHTATPNASNGTGAHKPPPPPIFLPLGGPKNILEDGGMLRECLSEEMEQIWKHAEATIIEEEKVVKGASMSEEQLRERYGALDVPDSHEASVALVQKQLQIQQFVEAVRRLQAQKLSGDVAMGGTDGDGDASAASGAHPTPKANMYHEARDPRRRV